MEAIRTAAHNRLLSFVHGTGFLGGRAIFLFILAIDDLRLRRKVVEAGFWCMAPSASSDDNPSTTSSLPVGLTRLLSCTLRRMACSGLKRMSSSQRHDRQRGSQIDRGRGVSKRRDAAHNSSRECQYSHAPPPLLHHHHG